MCLRTGEYWGSRCRFRRVTPPSQSNAGIGRAAAPAPGREPRVLAEIMEELQRPRTAEALVATLGSMLRARPTLEGGVERVRSTDVMARLRELDMLGWVEPFDAHWRLTEEGRAIVEARPLQDEARFALALCVRHEGRNQRVVTRLLRRMLALNPGADGLVVTQRPRVVEALVPSGNEVPRLRVLIEDWWHRHVEAMPGMTPQTPPPEVLSKVAALCGSRVASATAFALQRRLDELLVDALNEALFGDLVGPRDLPTWQRRMDRAGIALRTRRLPDRPGGGWFPTGSFTQDARPEFVTVAGLIDGSETWAIRALSSPEADLPFARALYAAYSSLRASEEREYVSLLAARDLVCHRLRVGNPAFERTLQAVFPKAIRGDLPYAMALEVDLSPRDRQRLLGALEVVVDGAPRYILSMRRRASSSEDTP